MSADDAVLTRLFVLETCWPGDEHPDCIISWLYTGHVAPCLPIDDSFLEERSQIRVTVARLLLLNSELPGRDIQSCDQIARWIDGPMVNLWPLIQQYRCAAFS